MLTKKRPKAEWWERIVSVSFHILANKVLFSSCLYVMNEGKNV